MFRMFANKTKDEGKKIDTLMTDREETRKRIRKTKEQMDKLVQYAAKADDLDRRIYSADYRTLKDQLLAEMQHFEDVGRLVRQLRNADLTRQRAAAMEKIARISNQMDLDGLIMDEDYVSVRREMLAEDDEQYLAAIEQNNEQNDFGIEDEEFGRLVARAIIKGNMAQEDDAEKTTQVEMLSL